MRPVYRYTDNERYWEQRWADAGADKRQFDRLDFYPIKYAEHVMQELPQSASVLEAGCGPGRVFFHYADQGYDMTGVDFSTNAIDHIREVDPDAAVQQADVRDLPFDDGTFDAILAFGLFHNFEDPQDLAAAFAETTRVLASGGKFVASVRCDSLENHLIEYVKSRRTAAEGEPSFHKLHFTESDLRYYLETNDVSVTEVEFARNVSFLFNFQRLRARHLRGDRFDESVARSSGFQLNWAGSLLDTLLHGLSPRRFSNVLVAQGEKT